MVELIELSPSPPLENSSGSRSRVYVIPPHLSPSQKSKYRDISEDGGFLFPIDEVVGKVEDDKGRSWYFARYKGGIIRAVSNAFRCSTRTGRHY